MNDLTLNFVGFDELSELADLSEVDRLTERLAKIKSSEILARNDALQVSAVYGKRRALGEEHRVNPYGFRVWWLTQETKVIDYTRDLVSAKGSRYIMRPEFILNFIALSPSTVDVRKIYETVFPTLLGIKLSNRMREEIFESVIGQAKYIRTFEDALANVMMAELSNELKGDRFNGFESMSLGGVS